MVWHTGEKIYLTLRPAAADSGIIFVRVDADPVVEIPALTEFVGNYYPCHYNYSRWPEYLYHRAFDVGF